MAFSTPLYSDEVEVTITRIGLEIEGSTRPAAVLKELGIEEGKVFNNFETLEDILASRANDLEQRRLFKVFEWSLEQTGPDTAEIDITIVDSFTIYPRPMFKYSSNTGFLIGLKLEYFNAFGTLTDQIIEGYWSQNEIKGRIEINEIIIGFLHLNLTFEQFYGATRYGSPSGDVPVHYESMETIVTGLLDIPFSSSSLWSYQVEPILKGLYNYGFFTNTSSKPNSFFENEGFAGGFNHGIYSDQVGWIRNFRRGFKFSFMNNNLWYESTGRSEIFLESDLYGYLPLTSWFEISGRVGGFYAFEGIRRDAGDRLRGVIDFMTYGQFGIYMTAQTDFRVIPSFGFVEVHLRPFADIGYVKADGWGHGPESWEYCVGSTLIFYFDALPSLILNLEYGWDFKRSMPEVIIDTKLLL